VSSAMDVDMQIALNLWREFNANPRRASATRTSTAAATDHSPSQTPQQETRATKRARTSKNVVPLTPISMASTPAQPSYLDESSSPLSSPVSSEHSLPKMSQTTMTLQRNSSHLSSNCSKLLPAMEVSLLCLHSDIWVGAQIRVC
jgi:hypothetical protein